MNHEVASLVSMGLLKCIQRFEEGKANGADYLSYYKWYTSYIAHWKKHAHLAIIMARKSACLLIHSFVPSLCKPDNDCKSEKIL